MAAALLAALALAAPTRGGAAPLLGAQTSVVPEEPPAVLTMALRRQLEELLDAPEAALRGEAAVALALTRDSAYYRPILHLAGDRDPSARLPAFLALGHLAAPGAESFLGRVLLDHGRPEADREVAAFALGLLPADQPVPAIHEYLVRIDGGSYDKHRNVLAALLLGLGTRPHPERAAAIRHLLLDAANKEPELHQLGLRAMALVPGSVSDSEAESLLDSNIAAARLAMVASFAALRPEPQASEVVAIEKLAKSDADPGVRAAALRLLTGWRRLTALELSLDAIRSPHPDEAAAALEAAMRLGGGSVRRAAEERILATADQALQAAMLRAHTGPWSPGFLRACAELAADRHRAPPVRVAAACIAARGADERVAPLLRDLFRELRDPSLLREVCRAMLEHQGRDVAVASLWPPASPEDAKLLPARIRALVAAGHPQAQALVHTVLGDERLPATEKAAMVRAFRVGAAPARMHDAVQLAPPSVLALLQ